MLQLIARLVSVVVLAQGPGAVIAADLAAQAIVAPPRDAVAEMVREVRARAGGEAEDCGQWLLTPALSFGQAPARESDLRRSVACITRAAKRRKPSFVVVQEWGFDSVAAMGLVTNPEGLIQRFDYDGALGAPRFALSACGVPYASSSFEGYASILCKAR